MPAVRIAIQITPRAAADRIEGWSGEELRVRVTVPPVEGRANAALVRLLARALGIAPSRVRVLAGATSRRKLVEIEGLSLDEVKVRLGGA
ncbi:MAG TPA: DUF167 domain-containing protein [Dehalococcoidia bacterium]|nr:DUF167 domain-containing protein [Dehalococcoidia bacterium]